MDSLLKLNMKFVQDKNPNLLLKVATNATSSSRPICLAYAVGARHHNGLWRHYVQWDVIVYSDVTTETGN